MATGEGLLLHPLPAPCLATSHHPAWHIYLHVTWIRARLFRPHARKHACIPRPVPHRLSATVCVPAARLCIYASGTKPLSRAPRGNVLSFKDEGSKSFAKLSLSLSLAKSGSFFFGKRLGVGTVRWEGWMVLHREGGWLVGGIPVCTECFTFMGSNFVVDTFQWV